MITRTKPFIIFENRNKTIKSTPRTNYFYFIYLIFYQNFYNYGYNKTT